MWTGRPVWFSRRARRGTTHNSTQADRQRPLRLELLEHRHLLATVTVDTLIDEQDGDITFGDVSLRDAINLSAANDVINFAVSGTINLTLGELTINKALTIAGPGAEQLTIDASGSDPTPNIDQGDGSRVFFISDDNEMNAKTVVLAGMTITGGDVDESGGGIHADEFLILSRSVVEGNAAMGTGSSSGRGGGIYAHRGRVSISKSTIRDNFAELHGGGIRVDGIVTSIVDSTITGNVAGTEGGGVASVADGPGDLTAITNTTISGNTAGLRGGGVWNSDGLTVIQHATITNNTTDIVGLGGGVGSNGQVSAFINPRTEVYSSIIAGNIGSDVAHVTSVPPNNNTFVSNGFNVIGSGIALGAFTNTGDQTNVNDPGLGPLTNNGGLTATHALLAGSAAIDRGDPNVFDPPEFDQRSELFSRVVDGGVGGMRIDVGAVERQAVVGLNLVVDTTDDEQDGNYDAADLSLREAVGLANGSVGADTIVFDTNVFATPQTIELTLGEMQLSEAVTLNGPGQLGGGGATIDAQFGSRIFNIIATSGDFMISGLSLTGGRTTGNNVPFGTTYSGGAIRSVTTGNLTIDNSTISGSSTIGYLAAGGGVFSRGDFTLMQTTVSSNSTSGGYGYGGGISSFGDVTLMQSTVRGNTTSGAAAYGGGVSAFENVTVTQSTVKGNTTAGSFATGGGISASDDVTLTDSIVDGNRTTGTNAHGGGIASFGALSLMQSTVSGNRTSGSNARGGGMYSFISGVALANSTVTDNHTSGSNSTGGGIAHLSGPIVVTNSILSANSASGGMSDLNPGSGTLSANYSLMGTSVTPDAGTSGNNAFTDDPRLGPLADHGGPTLTHALLRGSLAIDAGDPSAMPGIGGVPEFDQRGAPFSRSKDGSGDLTPRMDIGAFEVQLPIPVCDINGDAACDMDDIDALVMEIVAGTNNAFFDLTDDSFVNSDDLDAWLVEGGANNPAQTGGNAFLKGDANLDGIVDGLDFMVWNGNKFRSTGAWSLADWNADGMTDGHDLLIWNGNKFLGSDAQSRLLPSLQFEDVRELREVSRLQVAARVAIAPDSFRWESVRVQQIDAAFTAWARQRSDGSNDRHQRDKVDDFGLSALVALIFAGRD